MAHVGYGKSDAGDEKAYVMTPKDKAKDIELDPKLVALHKHWIIADSVKVAISSNSKEGDIKLLPKNVLNLARMSSMFNRLIVWYALLYVVVEGYLELRMNDEAIDILLKEKEYVAHLRKFRNSTFHYQKHPISEKTLGFLEEDDSARWIQELNLALKLFLEKELKMETWLKHIHTKGCPSSQRT